MKRAELPETVRLPDGRTEPFEPERITRSLFAAAERVGRPDAFLARELTESVLHFLSAEGTTPPTTPGEIADLVVKVVRELGQPDLAEAFAHRSDSANLAPPIPVAATFPARLRPDRDPAAVVRSALAEILTDFSLTRLFPRELVSAHEEGLIRLTGLATPLELAGSRTPLPATRVAEAMSRAREASGEFVAVDGPEYDLADRAGEQDLLAAAYAREIASAAQVHGLTVILNLHIASPPPRLSGGSGPLFESGTHRDGDRRKKIATALADRADQSAFTVWWHLTATEARGADPDLQSVVRAALAGKPVEFVFDRPRTSVHLGPGVDRQTPATLIQVGVNLAHLVQLMGGYPVDPIVFLRKVGSLTRFAKTAAHVKLDFLRRHGRPAIREAFLLDRARLVLVPAGLSEAARASDGTAAEFARMIVKTMRYAAETDRPRVLPVRVDCSLSDSEPLAVAERGLPLHQQVKLASSLHAAVGAGRLDLNIAAGHAIGVPEAIETIQLAAESSVSRLRFTRF